MRNGFTQERNRSVRTILSNDAFGKLKIPPTSSQSLEKEKYSKRLNLSQLVKVGLKGVAEGPGSALFW